MSDNVLYLWAAGVLVALFGIWYCLYTRLPKGNGSEPGQKRLSKQEKAALLEEQQLEKLLAKRGISLPVEDSQPAQPRVSPPANVSPTFESTAAKMAKKYGKKVD